MSKTPKSTPAKKRTSPTYAWNFNVVFRDEALGCRAISNDTIGVIKLHDGRLEFWHQGIRHCRTRSFRVLFTTIARVEKAT